MQKSLRKLLVFGKELSIFTGILLVLLFVFSCNNILMRNSGSLVITVPGARAATASSFTIELTGSSGATQSKTVSGGSTVQFDDLDPDTYTISVKGMDDTSTLVLSGSATATVVAGKTATVLVNLESSLGTLAVSFEGAESASVEKYSVTLSGPGESKETKEVKSRSVSFEGLISGSYTISVKGMDDAGTVVLSGSAKATVVAGKTATVPVNLESSLGNLAVSFEGAESASVEKYSVTLSGPGESKETKEVKSRSVSFEGLIPGEYTINVNGINAANITVLSGSVKATVVEGQTVPATVTLQEEVGRLSVTLTVPDGSIAQSYTVEITGANGFTQNKPVSGGTTVQFDNLAPGAYNIVVEGINERNVVVFGGSKSVVVKPGENASVMIALEALIGELTVNLLGTTATKYTIELKDSKGSTQKKEFSAAEDIEFDELPLGSCSISVKGTDTDDTIVCFGTSNATIKAGELATAEVSLAGVVNDLNALKNAIPNGGIIYVGSDISIDATITETPSTPVTIQAAYKDVTLSWTGTTDPMFQPTSGDWTFGGGEYTITLVGGSMSKSIIKISADGTPKVTLTTNGVINIKNSSQCGVIISDSATASNGIFCLDGGSITGSAAHSVEVYANGQFIMKSGFIEASAEKVVYMYGGTFSMTGGNIHNSSTNAKYSSVFVNNGSFIRFLSPCPIGYQDSIIVPYFSTLFFNSFC